MLLKSKGLDTALTARGLKARGAEEVKTLPAVIGVISNVLKAVSCPNAAEACGQLPWS